MEKNKRATEQRRPLKDLRMEFPDE